MSILTTCSGSSTRQRVARDCHEMFFISRRRAALNLIGWQSGFLIKTRVISGVGRTRAASICAAEAILGSFVTKRPIVAQRIRPHPATFPVQLAEGCIKLHGVSRDY